MPERNPYENPNTEIPQFVEKKAAPVANPAPQVKKEVEVVETVEEEVEVAPQKEVRVKRRLNVRNVMLALAIACGVLLICTVGALVYGINQHNELTLKQAELDQYVKNVETRETSYKQQIADLEKKLEEAKQNVAAIPEGQTSVKYRLAVGVNIRTGADVSYDTVDASKLPSDFKDLVDGTALIEGVTVNVTEIVEKNGRTWGKIADNAWFCIANGNDVYATRVD